MLLHLQNKQTESDFNEQNQKAAVNRKTFQLSLIINLTPNQIVFAIATRYLT